ncbi:hypothetical protein ACQKOE_14025 [Novosphingobium sp. NPDC080210]|uniref:hypothetical protein n=1 Tax=Novosphingobium sp. NPDC080210 TaxID=3390596 RepID=UPI003D063D27
MHTKVTIENNGLKSVFEWNGLIGLDMADALNAAIVTAMGEKHELDLLWTIAKIRQATGLNEKPMLSELPEAIAGVMQKADAKIVLLETALRQIEVDATEQHADWCNFEPEVAEARRFAFDVAEYCRAALKGEA